MTWDIVRYFNKCLLYKLNDGIGIRRPRGFTLKFYRFLTVGRLPNHTFTSPLFKLHSEERLIIQSTKDSYHPTKKYGTVREYETFSSYFACSSNLSHIG